MGFRSLTAEVAEFHAEVAEKKTLSAFLCKPLLPLRLRIKLTKKTDHFAERR